MKPIPVYADTSVFGGVFDDEFKQASTSFFQHVKTGKFKLILSTLVRDEIESAPNQVKQLFEDIRIFSDISEITENAIFLQQAYLQAGIVHQKWEADALHVALATTHNCSLIVSWNFKHIVHFQKIPLYNEINQANGYPSISIHSPLEVIHDDEEENV